MAKGAGYEIGRAFIDVVPSFDNTQRRVNAFVSRMRPIDIPARIDAKDFSSDLRRAAERAAKDTQVDLGKPKFDLSDVGKQLAGVGKGQKVELSADLDTKLADAKARELAAKRISLLAQVDLDLEKARAQLAEFESRTPDMGVDVDLQTASAEARITALEAKRRRVEIQADADTAAAQTKLSALDGTVSRLDGRKAEINVESSEASRAIGIMALLTAGVAAVGYAAPAAAAAIAAIPAAISGAGQGIGALVAGFSGIGTALKAYQAADDEAASKATSNAKTRVSALNAVASAQSGLASAQSGLASARSSLASAEASADHAAVTGAEQVTAAREAAARAQESLARAQESSLRRVQDAERSLATAQASARDAQDALNQAREDAKQRIEDLKLSLKGAALDEESAALALERAQAKLQALKNAGLGPSSLDYREADLAARQAAQTLDEVRQRYADLQKQSQHAAQTGVEGDKAVIAAHKQAEQATARAQDAERSLTQARSDGAREVQQAQAQAASAAKAVSQAQEHAAWANEAATKAVADAQRGLADAQRGVADAQRNLAAAAQKTGQDGSSAMDKFALAMSKLSPAGRSFVSFLQQEAKPAFQDMGDAVQTALLPKLTVAFRNLLELTPELTAGLTDTANVIGDLALRGSRMMTSGPWRKDFATIMKDNNQVMYDLGGAGLSIADSFRSILVAGGPVMRNFAQIAANGAEAFNEFIQGKRSTGELTRFMSDAGDKLKDVLRFLFDVGKAVFDLATALSPLGGVLVKIVDSFAKLISSFSDAHPLLTNIFTGAGLAATALLLLGRSINGLIGAYTSGKLGLRRFTTGLKEAAEGTSRWSGVAEAAVNPMGKLRTAAQSLTDAYREGDRATRQWLTTQASAKTAPTGGGNAGADLVAKARQVDQMRSRLADFATGAQTMASRVGAAASSAADSILNRIGPASLALVERMDDVGAAVSRTTSALGIRLVNGIEAARNPAELLDRTMARVATGVENAGAKLRSAFNPPARETAAVLDQGTGAAARMADAVRTRLSAGVTIAGNAVRGLGPAVRDGLTNAVSVVSGAATGIGTRIREGLSNAVTSASESVRGGMSRAADAFEGGLNRLAGAAGGTARAIGTGLKGAVSGLVGVLGGPWGIAITGASLLLSAWVDKQQEAARKVQDYQRDVDSLTEAYKQSNGVIDQNIINTNNKALADKAGAYNARAAGSSFEIYAAAANGSNVALGKVAEASDAALRSIARGAGLTGEQADKLAGLGREALNTGKDYGTLERDVFNSTLTFDDYGNTISGLNKEQTAQVRAIIDGVGAVGEQIKANRDARNAYLLLESAASKVTTQTVKQWEAQQKLRDTTKELAEASLSLRDAQADLEQSQKAIAQAQDDYNAAVKDHSADSKEARDAADQLTNARRSEEHSILSLLDAAQREAEARNHSLPELEREAKSTEARNKALLDLVKTYKGPLPDAVKDSVKGMDLAGASAAGFTAKINDLGQAIVELPDGTTIKIDADDRPARQKIETTLIYANGQHATATLFADTDPATGQTIFWQRNADGTVGRAQLDAAIDPATGKVTIWKVNADGTKAKTTLDAYADPATGAVDIWKDKADHTKGKVTLEANTKPAEDALNTYKRWMEGFLSDIGVFTPKTSATDPRAPGAPPLPFHNASGSLLEFYASGGFRQLQGMSARVASIVPPNSWRVVGDRPEGDEAFIPVNDSPRSVAILRETARRMGFLLAPLAQMALGGVLGFASGAVTTPAASAGARPASPDTASALPMSADQLDALTAAMEAATDEAAVLSAGLAALQTAVMTFTASALVPLVGQINGAVNPALTALMALHPPVRAAFTTTAATVASSTASMTTATGTAVGQMGGYLAALRTGLAQTGQAFADTAGWVRTSWSAIRGYTRGPVVDTIAGPVNAGLIASWNYLDASFGLNHHLQPIPIGFAEGGQVRGPGTGTSDSILTRLSNGEYVIPAALTRRIFPFLEALRAGQAEALQAAGYAQGGIVADTGSALNAQIAKAQAFAAAQRGKPYVWGASGPMGYDCSGLASAITNVLLDAPTPYKRLGVAASEPWPGFVRGLSSAWALGASPVHTAGTLGGVNAESTGNHVRFGGDAHGADDPQFRVQSSLPVVGGTFVSGGGANWDPAALVASAFAETAGMIQALRGRYPGNIAASTGAGEAAYGSDRIQKIAVEKISANTVGGGPAVAAAQNFARSALPRFGWGPEQMAPLIALWQGESGWNYLARNPSSGAYGIPQALPPEKMSSVAPDWRTNAATQILWGLGYIRDRPDYGSPAAAYAKWRSRSPHWYDDGGWLPPGYSTVANHTGKPEAVLTQDQWNALTSMAGLQRGGGGRSVTVNARTDASPEHIAHVVDRHLSIGSRL
ncbi:aggregation-promoting factor C-terminal-like domain-containing protein [Amycolatopsis dendrobii]|uniref:Uncharacterized protein n=1 Tax=Amycolatopsis dendrobii TaxID=2760662 RepID=A0A7W3ZA85_9PSEU|nr:hypothetical protein [Amycolatopsis dendrobii]MBB1153524.1 hypothetical protein [Amycolatopsis dendrobii]